MASFKSEPDTPRHTRRAVIGGGAMALTAFSQTGLSADATLNTTAAQRLARSAATVAEHQSALSAGFVAMTIAASDSSDADKSIADIVCNGVDDQDEINLALGVGDRQVLLLNGTYQIDSPILLPTGASLRGNSVFGVNLVCNSAAGVMRCNDPRNGHEHVLVDSMRFSPGTHRNIACDFRGFTRSQFIRLRVYQFDLGVWFGGDLPPYEASWTNVFSRFYLSENVIGVRLAGLTSTGIPTANQIILSQGEIICSQDTRGIGIEVVNGELVVDTCDIGYGDFSDGIVLREEARYCRVTNSRFEWHDQQPDCHPIMVEAGSFDHYFTGNSYTDRCTVPNLLDRNGAKARYIRIDDFPATDAFPSGYIDLSVDTLFSRSITFAGEIRSTGGEPAAFARSAAGSGASASIEGSHLSGLLTLTTGSDPASGEIAAIIWASEKSSPAYAVQLTPANANAVTALTRLYVDHAAQTSTDTSLAAAIPLDPSTEYRFFYTVTGYSVG